MTFSSELLPTSSQTNARLRQQNTRRGNHSHYRDRIHSRLVFHRGARNGHQTIDGHTLGMGVKLTQFDQQPAPVIERFTHTDDTPTANADPSIADSAQRF